MPSFGYDQLHYITLRTKCEVYFSKLKRMLHLLIGTGKGGFVAYSCRVEDHGSGHRARRDAPPVTQPYPIYADDVLEFFQLAGQPCWSDDGYDPAEAARMLENDEFIERATLEEIKSMLTYCVRGEWFCDGHWEAVLQSGRVTAILRRLAVLKESLGGAL